MRIKHIICIFLIFAMVPVTAFANNISQSDDSAHYTVLTQLDIIPSNISERYEAHKGITRGEFVQLVARCMGFDSKALSQSNPYFDDVSDDTPYYHEVNYCASLGLISGNGNRIFNPESKISVNEAIKIVITSLGYQPLADYNGGYPLGYVIQANKLDILTSLPSNGDKNITMGESLALIYNVINTPVLEQTDFGSDSYNYTNTAGKTLLSLYRRIHRYEGVVQGVPSLTFENIDVIQEEELLINNIVYKTKIDCSSFAGVRSEYYYNEKTKTVEAIIPLTDYVDVEIIDGNNVVSFNQNTLVYEIDMKEAKAALSKNVKVAYNGRPLMALSEDDFLNVEGTIKLIDNDDNGDIDYVIISSVENYVVKSVNVNKQTIYDMYDAQKNFNADDVEHYIFKNQLGDTISFDELTAYDVVSVYESKDKKFANMILSNSEAIGNVEEISTSDDGLQVVISGKQYIFSENYAHLSSDIKPGDSGVFLLDANGNIAGLRQESDIENWGYVIKAGKNEGLDTIVKVKMLTQTGLVEILELSEKVLLDGESKECVQVCDLINNNANGQIVRYKAQNDIIKSIDTLTKGQKENDISLNALHECYDSTHEELSKLRWSSTQYILGGKVPVGARTPIFCIPDDLSDDEGYKVLTRSYFHDGNQYPVNAYRTNESTHFAEALVMYGSFGTSQISQYSKVMLVESLNDAINEYGEHVHKLYGLHNNKKVSYYIKDQKLLDNLKSNKTSQKHSLACGDVIKVGVNTETNEIEKIILYYEKDKDYLHGPTAVGENVFGENRMMKVNVYSRDSGNLWLTQDPLNNEDVVLTTKEIESVNLSSYQLYKYSIGKDSKPECSLATPGDIVDYKSSAADYTKAIMFSMYTDSGTIIIYEN